MNLPRPFGPYVLVRQLAVGGMAEVFLAQARSVAGFEKTVALKMIHPHFSEDAEFARLLVEEANITAQLSHRNVVQVIDLGQIDATHFIAMEYVDGLDLARLQTRMRERDLVCSPRLAAFIMREVCEGLEHAHRKIGADGRPLKIIHRDVSPPNILLSSAGEVKLTDFGIAKAAMRAHATEAGVVKGKYAYMSPEQAKGAVLDPRTDLFAAGAVLYELATGTTVYPDLPLPMLIDKVTRALYVPPEKIRPDLPPALVEIIKRALSASANDRFPNALGMADALDKFLYTLAPNPEFELSQLMNTVLDAARPSMPPMGTTSLVDDDSDDSTQIESVASMRSKMVAPVPAAPVVDDGGFRDEPTRALKRGSVESARADGDEIDSGDAPPVFLPSSAAPRVRKPTPGVLPVVQVPSPPAPTPQDSPTIAPPPRRAVDAPPTAKIIAKPAPAAAPTPAAAPRPAPAPSPAPNAAPPGARLPMGPAASASNVRVVAPAPGATRPAPMPRATGAPALPSSLQPGRSVPPPPPPKPGALPTRAAAPPGAPPAARAAPPPRTSPPAEPPAPEGPPRRARTLMGMPAPVFAQAPKPAPVFAQAPKPPPPNPQRTAPVASRAEPEPPARPAPFATAPTGTLSLGEGAETFDDSDLATTAMPLSDFANAAHQHMQANAAMQPQPSPPSGAAQPQPYPSAGAAQPQPYLPAGAEQPQAYQPAGGMQLQPYVQNAAPQPSYAAAATAETSSIPGPAAPAISFHAPPPARSSRAIIIAGVFALLGVVTLLVVVLTGR